MPAGSPAGPTMTKSLYITGKRSTPHPSATKASSAARACTNTTSASPRLPVSSAWPVPCATTRTSIPVFAWNSGRMCAKRPEFSVEVVEATVMNSCAAAGRAPARARTVSRVRSMSGPFGWVTRAGRRRGRPGPPVIRGRRRTRPTSRPRAAGRGAGTRHPRPACGPGARSWVVITTVMPSAAKPSIMLSMLRVAPGSSWAQGSSRKSTSGLSAQARASARRCCSPPESSRAGRSASGSRPKRRSAAAARAARSGRAKRASASA